MTAHAKDEGMNGVHGGSAATSPADSFETFWPEYVRAHRKKATRQVHFVGTSLALACVAGAVVFRRPLLLLAAPVAGYGFAWASHLLIEKNRPATFDHPIWSLRADFVMWRKTLEGTMDAEVARILEDAVGPSPSEAVEPVVIGAPAVGFDHGVTNGAMASSTLVRGAAGTIA